MPSAYENFQQVSREAADLQGIIALADWDQETMMPARGLETRARQRSWLAQSHHRLVTGPRYQRALERALEERSHSSSSLTSRQDGNLAVAHREWIRQKKVPASWVKRLAAITPFALDSWARARQEARFELFAPWLEQIVELNQQRSLDLSAGDPPPSHPYDPLLDLFEPGLTLGDLEGLFGQMKPQLLQMREHALQQPAPAGPADWMLEDRDQIAFCRQLIASLGLSADRARLDISHHPFCTSLAPGDERLTTRLTAPHPWSAVMSTLHETGHGLYDQGLNPEEWGLPGGTFCSLGIHESQSRLWECRVGHSYPFLEWLLKQASRIWPQASQLSPLQLYRWLNRVRQDQIRVESDEVSYTLHIMLRTTIEAELISGKLAVRDLPERWNCLAYELLGARPAHDAQGCLQDVHWAHGEMGYFPSYALGNIYGAQLFAAYEKHHPGWESACREGQFESLQRWLSTHVWSHGRLLTPKELIQQATGTLPDASWFLQALRDRLETLGY